MHGRIAWLLAWLTLALVAVDVLIAAQAVSLISETAIAVHGFPFVDGAVVGSAVMGALIVSRYERHPIGWLLVALGVVGGVSLVTEAYAFWVQERGGPGPSELGSLSAWISQALGGQLAIAGLALMFLLAPDGHLLSRRWRYAAWTTGAGALLLLAGILSTKPTTFRLVTTGDEIGPVRVLMVTAGFLAVSSGLIASVVSMLLRLRRSSDGQRQQLRLIALAAALTALGLIWLFAVQAVNGDQQTWVASLPIFVAYFLLPILFAVAVLRHRLYELDVIINRTVVLVAGVSFAAVGYTVLVVTVGRMVEGRAGGFWLSLLGITVVALAFQPLRRRAVGLANRLAYGSRAQPYEALADFSRRLAEAPPAGVLLPAVAEAAARAVSARGAAATLDVPGGHPLTGSWGVVPDAWDHTVPVRLHGRALGRLDVSLPRGRALTPADVRLLEAVAEQTAVAFRNTSLASRLAGHVANLDRITRELAESRVRLVEADDAARRALDAAISRDVLPFLSGLSDRIRLARSAVLHGQRDPGLDQLVEETNTALESLRDLTRGVFPAHLARAGLEPAVRTLLTRCGRRPALTVDGAGDRRFSPRVEAAIYFCCAEAARSGGDLSSVRLAVAGPDLALQIDGVNWEGVDLQSISDRVEAVGGRLATDSASLQVWVPVDVGGPGSAVAETGAPSLGPGR